MKLIPIGIAFLFGIASTYLYYTLSLPKYEHLGPAIYSAITIGTEVSQTKGNQEPDNLLQISDFISSYKIHNKKIASYFRIYPINKNALLFISRDNTCVCVYQAQKDAPKPYGKCYYSNGEVVKIRNGNTQLEENKNR